MTAQVTLLDQSNNPTGTRENPVAVEAVGADGALALDSSVQAVTAAVEATTSAVSAVQTAVAQLHADLTGSNSTLVSINSAVGNVTAAVNAVTTAVGAVQAAVATGNVSSATIASQTASLTAALSNVQTLITSGNTALGTLHTDGMGLQGLVTTGNAALAAIEAATQAGATTVDMATVNASLASLNTAATTELATLDAIATDVTALGATLGGGATLAQIVTALNPLATSSDIASLQSTLSGFENSELTQLTAIAAAQPALDPDGGALAHLTNLAVGSKQLGESTAVAITYEQFNVLLDRFDRLIREVSLLGAMWASELRIKDYPSMLR